MLLDKILFSDRTPQLLKKTINLHLQQNSVIQATLSMPIHLAIKPLILSLVNIYRPQYG